MRVQIYRDCDSLRLRKVVVEVYVLREMVTEDGQKLVLPYVLDRSRCIAGPRFLKRLARKIRRAKRRAEIMWAAMNAS